MLISCSYDIYSVFNGFFHMQTKKKKHFSNFCYSFSHKNKKKTLKNKIWIIHKSTSHIILQNKKRKQNLYMKKKNLLLSLSSINDKKELKILKK